MFLDLDKLAVPDVNKRNSGKTTSFIVRLINELEDLVINVNKYNKNGDKVYISLILPYNSIYKEFFFREFIEILVKIKEYEFNKDFKIKNRYHIIFFNIDIKFYSIKEINFFTYRLGSDFIVDVAKMERIIYPEISILKHSCRNIKRFKDYFK